MDYYSFEGRTSLFYISLCVVTHTHTHILCGPILPCVQTEWEEARPNTILIRTNEAGKGPAQYPV